MMRAAAAVVLTVMVAAVGCESRTSGNAGDEDLLSAQGWDFTMEHVRDEQLRWRLVGERFEVTTTDETYVQQPRVVIYENGHATVSITGTEGTVDRDTQDFIITGDVKAVSPNGVLYTAKLLWKDADGKLIAPGAAEIHRGSSVIQGTEMIARPDLKQIHLNDVRFRVRPEDETIDAYPIDLHDE